jgi:hypothetical protein
MRVLNQWVEVKLKTMRFRSASDVIAYEAMLDKIRSKYAHLSNTGLLAKLNEARDEYARNLRKQQRWH